MPLIANGTDVGHYATSESGSEFYGRDEPSTHQAQGLDTAGVTTLPDTPTTYIYLHESTADAAYSVGIHHWHEGSYIQYQAQVIWREFSKIVGANSFVYLEDTGIDLTGHGESEFVFADGQPVRNAGGGSFVYEVGTAVTPASARTVAQDDPEDESATGQGADSYLANDDGDPETRHLWTGRRGDGGAYLVEPGVRGEITLEMYTLDDGRDDGQPLNDQWAVRGPDGTVTKPIDGSGASITITIETT